MSQQSPLDPADEPQPVPIVRPPSAHRSRSSLLVRAAAALLVVIVTGLLGVLAWDDVRAHRESAQQARRVDALSREAGALRAQRDRLNAQRDQLNAQVLSMRAETSRLQADARSPTLIMWNACGGPCTIGPGAVRVGSVPDTFQLLIAFTATVPVRSYVFTFHQWTQFDGCGFNVRCVTGNYRTFDAATSMDATFTEAEGCSGYVWVMQADRDGTIQPNVRVHYRPADHPTGVCAGS